MADSLPKKKPSSNPSEGVGASAWSIADIKELFVLMRDNEIAELQLEQHETRIHIVGKGAPAPQPQMIPMMGMPQMQMMGMPPQQTMSAPAPAAPSSEPSMASIASAGPAAAASVDTSSAPANIKTVYSPMVGTFYMTPAPDAPPFVRVGDMVSDDTVLCIIEAMKLMNEIKAETKGKIYKILVETGMPVEYNQPLFLIEP